VGLNAGLRQTGNRVFLAGLNSGSGSTASDLIAIGDQALGASAYNGNSGTGFVGTGGHVCIGTNAGANLTGDYSGGVTEPAVIIGYNTYQKPAAAGGMVVIGSDNLGQFGTSAGDGPNRSVMIGNLMFNGNQTLINNDHFAYCVLIGYNVVPNPSYLSLSNSIFIGPSIGSSLSGDLQSTNNVVVGYNACQRQIPSSQSVIIGAGALPNFSPSDSSLVSNVIAIGQSAAPQLSGSNVASDGIFIGTQAGDNFTQEQGVLVIIPTPPVAGLFDSLICGRIYASGGVLQGGNLCLGGALAADTDIDLPGAVNIVKLMNGSAASAGNNPHIGGYFYASAGALHWVGSNGTDTEIAPA
jgi:hypothetical protein